MALLCEARPMIGLFASLCAFFSCWSDVASLDGSLRFADDGSSSEFRRRPLFGCRSPWAELSVIDPTCPAMEGSDLTPKLLPATQVLLSAELCRVRTLLGRVCDQQASGGGSPRAPRHHLQEIFDALPESANSLPSFVPRRLGVLMLVGDPAKDVGVIEVAVIERVVPRPGWAAPFLHRADIRSELFVHLCDVQERSGKCKIRKGSIVLCPCHFVCRVNADFGSRTWILDEKTRERLLLLRRCIAEMGARHQAMKSLPRLDAAREESNGAASTTGSEPQTACSNEADR